jgi:hypothetical protein
MLAMLPQQRKTSAMAAQNQIKNVKLLHKMVDPWSGATTFKPRAADLRRARGTTRLQPDAAGRSSRRRRGRRACGRCARRGDSRARTAAWSRRRRAAVLALANRAARFLPAPRPALPHWCGAFRGRRQDQIGGGHRRHFDSQIDAVHQRARDARLKQQGRSEQAEQPVAQKAL